MLKKMNSRKSIKYLAVIGLLVFFYSTGLLSPLEGGITRILNPILSQAQSWSSSLNEQYKKQTSKIDFAQTIKSQQSEINKLLSENAELKIAQEENKIMRKYLNFFSSSSYNKILAKVISRGSITNSMGVVESIDIDKGKHDGLYPGLVVVNEDGIVVGKIAEVKEDISKIDLVLNDKFRIAAAILGDDKTSGIVEGKLGLTMQMDFIPQSKNIKREDIVVTSGLEELIPRGLVIGQISNLTKENNELWQEAVLDSNINFDELMIVSVLLP